jgi:arylsulfatase A-like enzyme
MATERPRVASPVPSRWRYRVVVGLICVAVVVAAAAGWRYARTSGPAFGPIVLVSIEALRADHLPVYGYTKVATPALDALAADGVVFDRAYAHTPLTLPSHVCMLSGRLPFETGVRDDVGFAVPADLPLLSQLLHRRGFKTGGIVSSYLLRRETGLGQAFAFFDDELEADPGPEPSATDRDGRASVQVARHWMDSFSTGRFFLFLQLDEPEAPRAAPRRYGQYVPYDGKIAYADELVGRLVQRLKDRGLYDDAVVVVTSDHGEGLGDHGEQEHGLLLHEEVLRVPLIIKLPRNLSGGQHARALVQHIDLVPTILDLAGAPKAPGARGRSLRPVFESPDTDLKDRRIYGEALAGRLRFGWSGLTSVTDATYRFVQAPRPELYDVLQDPHERHDLAEARPAVAAGLAAALDRFMAGRAVEPPAAIPAAERGRLLSLGYTGSVAVVSPDTPPGQLADPKDMVRVFEGFRAAARLAGRRQVSDAVARYREVLAEDPSLVAGWEQLSGLLLADRRVREAGEALTRLTGLYRDAARETDIERTVQGLVAGSPTADEYALAIRLWTTLGDKPRAAELRTAARQAVGDPDLRRAEAALEK